MLRQVRKSFSLVTGASVWSACHDTQAHGKTRDLRADKKFRTTPDVLCGQPRQWTTSKLALPPFITSMEALPRGQIVEFTTQTDKCDCMTSSGSTFCSALHAGNQIAACGRFWRLSNLAFYGCNLCKTLLCYCILIVDDNSLLRLDRVLLTLKIMDSIRSRTN